MGSGRRKLLLVEEDKAFAKDLLEVLKLNEWDVLWAKSAQEGLDLSKEEIELVLVDASVEDFFTLEVIREISQTRKVPLVTICKRSDVEFTDRFLQDGAVDVIVREDVPVTAYPLLLTKAIYMHTYDHDKKRLIDRLQGRYWVTDTSESRDPETGLYTQAYIAELLQLKLSHAKEEAVPIGILLLSVDQWSQLPQGGDHQRDPELRREVGQFILRHLRTLDLLGCHGASSFVAVLPGADPEGVRSAAIRILDETRGAFFGEGRNVTITLSCGAAVYDPGAEDSKNAPPPTWSGLLEQAEKNLQAARRAGGDQAHPLTEAKTAESPAS